MAIKEIGINMKNQVDSAQDRDCCKTRYECVIEPLGSVSHGANMSEEFNFEQSAEVIWSKHTSSGGHKTSSFLVMPLAQDLMMQLLQQLIQL